MDLRATYNEYIETLNNQGYKRLAPFVHDNMIHNDSKPMSPDAYGQMILDTIQDFPGFRFHVEMLTVEQPGNAGDGTVAARLRLSYAPLGTRTEAERVVFYEHVFYRFELGKIRRVWSLVDLPKTT
jgi:predicted ester cyclase